MIGFLNFLQAALAFILVLAPLVFIHEFGHFIVAKSFRIGVPVFSLGFGPRLFGFRRKETDYRLSMIPLGGYVRLAGDEADESRTGAPEEFLSRPKHQRFLVFVAGAAFNILLAFLTLWLVFGVWGKQEVANYPVIAQVVPGSPAERAGVRLGDTLIEIAATDVKSSERLSKAYLHEIALAPNTRQQLLVERDGQLLRIELDTGQDPKTGYGAPGFFPYWEGNEPPEIGEVIPGDPADRAGMRVGDRIVGAEGDEIISELQLRILIQASPDRELVLDVERGGERLAFDITPKSEDGRGLIGVRFVPAPPPPTVQIDLSLGEAAAESLRANLYLSQTLFLVLKKLFTAELPLSTMSGPLGIAQVARQALNAGVGDFLRFLAFVSLQLGILNLLPIPVLDGGHIVILLIEGVMRRDLSQRIKERVMQVGFVFLLALMGVIIYLDIFKMF